jgi:hypothetical protein
MEKDKISCRYQETNANSSVIQPTQQSRMVMPSPRCTEHPVRVDAAILPSSVRQNPDRIWRPLSRNCLSHEHGKACREMLSVSFRKTEPSLTCLYNANILVYATIIGANKR